jgi:hypothetical protein
MQKYAAELIGTFFLVLTDGYTVDADRHSVGHDERDHYLSQPGALQQN